MVNNMYRPNSYFFQPIDLIFIELHLFDKMNEDFMMCIYGSLLPIQI